MRGERRRAEGEGSFIGISISRFIAFQCERGKMREEREREERKMVLWWWEEGKEEEEEGKGSILNMASDQKYLCHF